VFLPHVRDVAVEDGVMVREGALVLADGSVFEGELIGAVPAGGAASGEVVFNTALSGYQEIVTDPSYAGQIICFTYPHIGNYGVNLDDFESRRPFCRGVVVRDLARRHSNWRAEAHLDTMLRAYGVPGIAGIDTRRLTRVIREHGAMPGAFGSAAESDLLAAARAEPGTDGVDLVAEVTTREPYVVDGSNGVAGGEREHARRPLVVAYDLGIKRTILRHLARRFRVEVMPASTPAADVVARGADGVFLSNGPGDPAMLPYVVDAVRGLVGQVPVFGICLGHQVLARAIGAETVKLPFGHHGANHPVRNLLRGDVEITSQNHNFAVEPASLGDVADVTHVNLNDGVCEGLRVRDAAAFSVQHHPEAGPGPHDATYLFDEFEVLLTEGEKAWRSSSPAPGNGPVASRPSISRPEGMPQPDAGVGA
jgi:carbamoyl-phosphate synthase small subunit